MNTLPRRTAVAIFLAFAFAYFFSALIRAITATLSPTLTQEFSLSASDLGLLAGGYFLGFAATQLRANSWMLMTGSLGMVASTLPVQWLLPIVGWRVLFWGSIFQFRYEPEGFAIWVISMCGLTRLKREV